MNNQFKYFRIMRKKFFSLLLFIISLNCYSQYNITYKQLNIISYSSNINYVNNNFSPDYNSTANTLRTLQARYDYYYKMLNTSWGKIRFCELINKENNKIIRNKDVQIENYLNANNHFKHIDLGRNGDFVVKVCNWMTDVFNQPNIKAEIKVLQAINNEYYRLKNTYPDDFYKRERYLELGKVLNIIENCSPLDIGKIGMEYGLF